MSDLKTDYKDDVLDTSSNTKRIFNLVDQSGNIVFANISIQDITKYIQNGDTFGAADINATNEAVNGKLDGSSTVNPMLATEEGFAADAYQTKLQLESCFRSVSNGKVLVASAITGKGVNTASDAALSTMANNINNIKDVANNTQATATAADITAGKTAWVNGKLISGNRPAPVNYLTGSVSLPEQVGVKQKTQTVRVTFSKVFDKVPTINLTYDNGGATVSNVGVDGFTITHTSSYSSDWKTVVIYWTATV